MKILFVVHAYKPAWRVGGPIHSVSALAEELVLSGHEVHVYTSNSNLDEYLDVPTGKIVDYNGVKVTYFKTYEPFKKYLKFIPYLSKSIGTLFSSEFTAVVASSVHTFDLVHTHLPFNYLTLVGAFFALIGNIPLVYHQRGVFDPARLRYRSVKKSFYLNLFEKPIMRNSSALIALTDYEKNVFLNLAPRTPCFVIPNGITLPSSDDLCPKQHDLLCNLGVSSDDQVILFMGRLHPTKGANILIDAFSMISNLHLRARLVICGPDEHGLQQALLQRSIKLGVSGKVIFAGMAEGLKKQALLLRADLFSLPSVAEGFSMAILEAMAHETPVLISVGCHFPEVEASCAGWLSTLDVEEYANKLSLALSSPLTLKIFGRNARSLVQTSYSWKSIAQRMISVYKSAIDSNTGFTDSESI